jgi:hypothetical protein
LAPPTGMVLNVDNDRLLLRPFQIIISFNALPETSLNKLTPLGDSTAVNLKNKNIYIRSVWKMGGVRKNDTFSSALDTRRKYLFSYVTSSIQFLEMYVTPGRRVWMNIKLWIQFSIYCGIKVHLDFIYWYVFYIRYKAVLSQKLLVQNVCRYTLYT